MIAVLGAGVMGEVFIAGLIRGGTAPERIVISEKRTERAQEIAQRYGVRAVSPAEAVAEAATVLLVTKPQDMAELLAEIGPRLADGTVVVSLAAGIRLQTLEAAVPAGVAVVRGMPNTPALVDQGITAISLGRSCNAVQAEYVESLLSAVGPVVRVPEDLQDAVTSTSGSGPAYVFLLIESMTAAAIELGVDAETARTLVVQTVLGAATMAAQPGADAATLRQQVTSPKGTTAAALATFEAGGFRELVLAAMTAARDRGRELGGG
ncbi:MAG: pyrroline-5-carboxylate reductase [Candidatus Nanopelagicales bacterium]